MRHLVWSVFLLVLAPRLSEAGPQQRGPAEPLSLYRAGKDLALLLVGRSASDPRLLRRAGRSKRLQPHMTSDFPCTVVPRHPDDPRPVSVHQLRPQDIDVIGAMGDSLTAGNGAAASNILHVVTENRGISWAIGGQGTWRDFLTLPNILREFNPSLIGFSLSDSFAHHRDTQFNVAEIGAMSSDLPYMAKQLVLRISRDSRVDLKNDWKLVTLMIGANDLCLNVCYEDNQDRVLKVHRQEIVKALKILKESLPRTLVNLVPAPDVSILSGFNKKPPLCQITHLVECPCLFGAAHKAKRKKTLETIKRWRQIDQEVADLEELNDRDDFAVVLQPFDTNLTFPTRRGDTDYSFLSTDCFHFSQKSHARASNALWNNMMEPEGGKSKNWKDSFSTFLCPTPQNPYIFTKENSRGSAQQRQAFNNNFEGNNLLKRSL